MQATMTPEEKELKRLKSAAKRKAQKALALVDYGGAMALADREYADKMREKVPITRRVDGMNGCVFCCTGQNPRAPDIGRGYHGRRRTGTLAPRS
jgi:hypothetical protein